MYVIVVDVGIHCVPVVHLSYLWEEAASVT